MPDALGSALQPVGHEAMFFMNGRYPLAAATFGHVNVTLVPLKAQEYERDVGAGGGSGTAEGDGGSVGKEDPGAPVHERS